MADDLKNFLETPDVTIYFEVRGASSGIPLFVLHGGPGFDHTYFLISSVWDDLGKNRPIIFYDQRGTGQSSPLEKGDSCTLADQLADLEALREHLGYDQADMLGHSWGGYLAMAYTARYPDRVRRLILVDSAAPRIQDIVFLFKDIYPETVERRESLAFAVELEDDDAIQANVVLYASMLCYSAEKRDALMGAIDPTVYRYYVNRTLGSDAERFDLNPELPKFRQPTMVITGRFDINVAPSVSYGIHKAISNSQFVVFEQSGHLPFFEEPEAFTKVVEQFLSER